MLNVFDKHAARLVHVCVRASHTPWIQGKLRADGYQLRQSLI